MTATHATMVPCRNRQLCKVERHFENTKALCGATSVKTSATGVVSTMPARTLVSATCPVHGPDHDEFNAMEIDLANFKRATAVGMIGIMGVFGACSCSPSIDPTDNPTVAIEQPADATPTADATQDTTEQPADALPSSPQNFDWESWPSLQADYVYSDKPQGAAEQWIADTYPDLWDAGVRATFPGMQYSWDLTTKEPEVRVQYINGERYEGTQNMPLGFGVNSTDANAVRTDTLESRTRGFFDPSQSAKQVGNTGFGAYSVTISENMDMQRGVTTNDGNDVEVVWDRGDDSTFGTHSMRFGTIDEALAWLDANSWTFDGAERTLSKGEIAGVTIFDETTPGKAWDIKVFNADTGKFEYVRSLDV